MAAVKSYNEYLISSTFRAIRAFIDQRSGGFCERCKTNRISDIHHKDNVYPPIEWGIWTIWDVPSRLQGLCRQCHCEIHGKEN